MDERCWASLWRSCKDISMSCHVLCERTYIFARNIVRLAGDVDREALEIDNVFTFELSGKFSSS